MTPCLLVCALVWSLAAAGSDGPRVRSTDAGMLERLSEGRSQSVTFRALVDDLEQTNTIVYVEYGICGFGHYRACLPHAVTIAGGHRYIRVLVDPGESGAHQLSLIAHELQHALEIARTPGIRCADDITALFRRIGRSPHCPGGMPDCFETSDALATGRVVLEEVLTSTKTVR